MTCKHKVDLSNPDTVKLSISLMGKGTTVMCKKCGDVVAEGITEKSENIPNWIRESIKRFWDSDTEDW